MESVSRIIKRLMVSEPFYGFFACSLNKKWTKDIPTAGVGLNGLNYMLYINKDFWDKIDENERYGTLKHELLHLAFFHVCNAENWNRLCSDSHILNVAMDLEVQSYINPKYWGDPNKYAAEGIFAQYPGLKMCQGTKYYINFLKNIQNTPQGHNANFDIDMGTDSNGNKKKDHHSIPNNTVQNIKNMIGTGPKDDHSVFVAGDEKMGNLIKSQLEYQLKEAHDQVIKSKGTIPAELKRILDDLLKIKPPVYNWKAYLRRMLGFAYDVTYKKTRRKESNRFPDSFGLKHNKKHSILVAIDTSGSINMKEFEDFFSEIYHIWKAGSDVDIIECDARIQKQYKYNGKTPKIISGGGGTSFLPCIEYYNTNHNKYNTMVYFTDGYGDQDKCKPFGKVLWMISSDGFKNGKYPGYKICIPKID